MEVSDFLTKESDSMARKRPGKSISFELLLDEGSKTRARIPLRVIVNHHDTTESVIATVKNFYGIYDGHGVSFEDSRGNTLIASYENLNHNTVVYVRSVPGPSQGPSPFANGQHVVPAALEPQRLPSLGEPFQMMLPPHMREQSHSPSRSSSRLARKRSASPHQVRGRRSASQQKPGSFSATSRGSSASGSFHEDSYSDSEAGRSSISGSRKAKSEQIASSDISTANVLQDGRRGQTIFDSSVRLTFRALQCATFTNAFRRCPSTFPLKSPSLLHSRRYPLNVAPSHKKRLHPSKFLHRSSMGFWPLPCSLLRAMVMAQTMECLIRTLHGIALRSRSTVIISEIEEAHSIPHLIPEGSCPLQILQWRAVSPTKTLLER